MYERGYREGGSSLFDRDWIDLVTWVAERQARVLEAEAYLHHVSGDQEEAMRSLDDAGATWQALRDLLEEIPELSILEAARSVGRVAPVSERVVESFWSMACDFYHGYPLVPCPEAIELVYQVQLTNLRSEMEKAHLQGEVARLEAPGWFWHDFPDPAWADAVRMLPRENAQAFEETMRARLEEAVRQAYPESSGKAPAASPSPIDGAMALEVISRILSIDLPGPRSSPPTNVPVPKTA
jgi:hypothetical protein